MTLKPYEETYISSIANSIRDKNTLPDEKAIIFTGATALTVSAAYNQTETGSFTLVSMTESIPRTLPAGVYNFSRDLTVQLANRSVSVTINNTTAVDGNTINTGTGTSSCTFTLTSTSSVIFNLKVTGTNRLGGSASASGGILISSTPLTFTVEEMAPAVRQALNYYLIDMFEGNIISIDNSTLSIFNNTDPTKGQTMLKTVNLPAISTIAALAFNSCSNLTTISAPSVATIYSSAFSNCINLRNVYLPKCSKIYDYAFYNCRGLESANFSNIIFVGSSAFISCDISQITFDALYSSISIYNYAFSNCQNLKSLVINTYSSNIPNYFCNNCITLSYVSIPNCTGISNSAFGNCQALKSISFPNVLSIAAQRFISNYNLSKIYLPSATSIGPSAFRYCSNLSSADLPLVNYIGNSAFRNCSNLSYFSAPLCSTMSSWVFYNTNLSSIILPQCTSLSIYTFASCYYLSMVSLPKITTLSTGIFSSCFRLLDLYLGDNSSTSICTIRTGAYATFASTPIAGYTTATEGVYGKIHVPASLLDTYKTATNWVTYSSRFVGDL